jgi:hypothetical protein
MTKGDDTREFIIGHTSPNNLIQVVFKKIRVIPKEIPYLNKKFLLVLCSPMRWDLPCNKKINNVSKPKQIRNIKELLI